MILTNIKPAASASYNSTQGTKQNIEKQIGYFCSLTRIVKSIFFCLKNVCDLTLPPHPNEFNKIKAIAVVITRAIIWRVTSLFLFNIFSY